MQYWILVQSRLILSCDTCLESNTVLQRVGKSERFFLGSEWLVIIPPKKKLFIFHTIATRPKPVQSKAVYCTVQCVVTSQKSVSRLQSSPEWSRFYGNGRRRWDLRCRYYWQLVLHQLLATKKHVSNQRELANEPIVGRSRSRGAEGAAAGKALLESCTSSSEKWSSGEWEKPGQSLRAWKLTWVIVHNVRWRMCTKGLFRSTRWEINRPKCFTQCKAAERHKSSAASVNREWIICKNCWLLENKANNEIAHFVAKIGQFWLWLLTCKLS